MKEIQKTIKLEGGLVNNPDDPGGLTKYGISQRAYPELDIERLTMEEAEWVYKVDYWDKLGLDAFTNMRFRWKVFDISVNMGVGKADAFLKMVEKKDTLDGVWELVEMQAKRYASLVVANPKLLTFLKGWINRAFDTGEDLEVTA